VVEQRNTIAELRLKPAFGKSTDVQIISSLEDPHRKIQTPAYQTALLFYGYPEATDTIPRAKTLESSGRVGYHGELFHAIQSISITVQARVETPKG
jgi:hypothetical protein